MDNHHLRAILLKLQDRLSDNDRRRLHFFLGNDVPRRIRDDASLDGTLCLLESLFDQDKINEQDFTFLINAFDEIQCTDAVKLLKEHKRRIQSNEVNQSVQSLSLLMPSLTSQVLQDEDDKYSVQTHLIDEINIFDNNNTTISNKNINNNPVVVTVNSPRKSSLPVKQKKQLTVSSMTQKYLLLFVLLSIILAGIVIGGFIWIIPLKINQTKNHEIIQYLKDLLSKSNETIVHLNNILLKKEKIIEELNKKVERLEEEQKFTEGSTCGCDKWCSERGSPYGVCGNGHTCICGTEPITDDYVGDSCTCNAWCRRHGYKNGGICGDGYTCICSK